MFYYILICIVILAIITVQSTEKVKNTNDEADTDEMNIDQEDVAVGDGEDVTEKEDKEKIIDGATKREKNEKIWYKNFLTFVQYPYPFEYNIVSSVVRSPQVEIIPDIRVLRRTLKEYSEGKNFLDGDNDSVDICRKMAKLFVSNSQSDRAYLLLTWLDIILLNLMLTNGTIRNNKILHSIDEYFLWNMFKPFSSLQPSSTNDDQNDEEIENTYYRMNKSYSLYLVRSNVSWEPKILLRGTIDNFDYCSLGGIHHFNNSSLVVSGNFNCFMFKDTMVEKFGNRHYRDLIIARISRKDANDLDYSEFIFYDGTRILKAHSKILTLNVAQHIDNLHDVESVSLEKGTSVSTLQVFVEKNNIIHKSVYNTSVYDSRVIDKTVFEIKRNTKYKNNNKGVIMKLSIYDRKNDYRSSWLPLKLSDAKLYINEEEIPLHHQ